MTTRLTRTLLVLAAVQACLTLFSTDVRAETVVAKGDSWEVFLNGRVNVFHSYLQGQAFPLATFNRAIPYDPMNPLANVITTPSGGGLHPSFAAQEVDPVPLGDYPARGRLQKQRFRSGLYPNILGFGVRHALTPHTTLTAYMSIWAIVESRDHRKYFPVPADIREGFLKFEGPWGSLLAGRAQTLFSRGATQINFLYGHGLGVGYPGNADRGGPAFGHIGFGVAGNGWAAGFAYATPKLAGLQLTVAYYDPAQLNTGTDWNGTKWGRPEAELTWDIPLGKVGRIHLFGNGAWQKLYQLRNNPASTAPFAETAMYGVGYGGRIEVGPVRLGLAGHWGKGLGLTYTFAGGNDSFETAVGSDRKTLRTYDGFYGQSQLVLGKWNLAAGLGVTRAYQLSMDLVDNRDNDNDPMTDSGDDDGMAGADPPLYSIIRQQLGASAAVTYHISSYLAFQIDYFRADFSWWLADMKQVVHIVNSGVTMLW